MEQRYESFVGMVGVAHEGKVVEGCALEDEQVGDLMSKQGVETEW